jgi:DNA-binding NtrC family response regulator
LARILVADDDNNVLTAIRLLLNSEQIESCLVNSPKEAIAALKSELFDAALLDLNFSLDTTSGREGLELVAQLRALDESLPIIVMTGWATIDLAVAAMQQGAGDFLEKPWENERLLSIINTQIAFGRNLRKSARLTEENQLLRSQLVTPGERNFIAESPAMQRLMSTVERVACSDLNILLTGENGTGKSLLARRIHQLSERGEQSFIVVNMGSISESLFESEMFGHLKGAFTDARATRIGRFELADKGSLFLDEIGNIPVSQQPKLLTVLEDCRFEKVGSSRTQQVDVRVISASNVSLAELIEKQQFRKDLLYRLNTVEIRLPPLRERLEDIDLLATGFVKDFAQHTGHAPMELSTEALRVLQDYTWPGNVRELRHVLERAVILSEGRQIRVQHLMLEVHATSSASAGSVNQDLLTLDEIERQAILDRMSLKQGNMKETARSLGLSRSAFYRRIDKYDL